MESLKKGPVPAQKKELMATLVASATSAARSEALVGVLYGTYKRVLFNQIIRLTNNDTQWAEDVVQETLIRAWQNMDWLNLEPRMLSAWLATVARRIVIDDWRRRRTRPQEVELTSANERESEAAGQDRSVSDMMVEDMLSRLTDKQRTVVVTTYVWGYTVREAALILGVPVGTVKSRLHSSAQAIRRVLWVEPDQ